jgi:hypothetical protein
LLKWEIAGVIPVDSRGFGQTLHDSYKVAGWHGTVNNKFGNAVTIIGTPSKLKHLYFKDILIKLRNLEFSFVFFGLGLLNFGWLAYLLPNLRKRLKKSGLNLVRLNQMFLIAGVGLIFWVIAMFGPNTTVIQSSSFLMILLLMVGLAGIISIFQKIWQLLIVITKVSFFLVVWIGMIYSRNLVSHKYEVWLAASAIGIMLVLNILNSVALPSKDI